MFACDEPQYSAQNPFHAKVDSGVNQTWFVSFETRSRLPPSCGIQNEWRTSTVIRAKSAVRPTGR